MESNALTQSQEVPVRNGIVHKLAAKQKRQEQKNKRRMQTENSEEFSSPSMISQQSTEKPDTEELYVVLREIPEEPIGEVTGEPTKESEEPTDESAEKPTGDVSEKLSAAERYKRLVPRDRITEKRDISAWTTEIASEIKKRLLACTDKLHEKGLLEIERTLVPVEQCNDQGVIELEYNEYLSDYYELSVLVGQGGISVISREGPDDEDGVIHMRYEVGPSRDGQDWVPYIYKACYSDKNMMSKVCKYAYKKIKLLMVEESDTE